MRIVAERSDGLETWESRKIQSWILLTTALSTIVVQLLCICSTISIDNEFERLSPWRSTFGLSWPIPETTIYFQMDSEIEQKTRCNFEKFVQHQCWPRNRVAKNRDGTYNLSKFIKFLLFFHYYFSPLAITTKLNFSLSLSSLKIWKLFLLKSECINRNISWHF